MDIAISSIDARNLISHLRNAPVAPGRYSAFINAGTGHIIDVLDRNYFRGELAEGIGCFKYLEGDYGSGKTQFINSLAQRAAEQDIVTAIVSVGVNCPFNSPAGIVRAVMSSFRPPIEVEVGGNEGVGIEILLDSWIQGRILEHGAEPGPTVPDTVQRHIKDQLTGLWKGAPDTQMAAGLKALSLRLLKINCGGNESLIDTELISWMRGDRVRSVALKEVGIYEPLIDGNAFSRLKTVIAFLRTRMGYRGFLIAFDEGTRTTSFRRGTVKQKQAIENMLTMINDTATGEFGGVMFLYAATPDFRSETIKDYKALGDRIGTAAFKEGRPLVPLIVLEHLHSKDVLRQIGERLLEVFGKAYYIEWDTTLQKANMDLIIEAQKAQQFDTPKPRFFVYQYCRFLEMQSNKQSAIDEIWAQAFVGENEPPLEDEGDES